MAEKIRFITSGEANKGVNLPYYKEYCVEDLPFPRELVCLHLETTIIDDRRYCVNCGKED